MEVGYRLDLD